MRGEHHVATRGRASGRSGAEQRQHLSSRSSHSGASWFWEIISAPHFCLNWLGFWLASSKVVLPRGCSFLYSLMLSKPYHSVTNYSFSQISLQPQTRVPGSPSPISRPHPSPLTSCALHVGPSALLGCPS